MRDLRELDHFRYAGLERSILGVSDLPLDPAMRHLVGAFSIPSPIDHAELRVIASAVFGWDHVSVSRPKRCPNWPEMCRIKDLFFLPEECVMQLHPPASDYVNNHPHCLHLWRPHDVEIPRPPSTMVGVAGMTPAETRRVAAVLDADNRAADRALRRSRR